MRNVLSLIAGEGGGPALPEVAAAIRRVLPCRAEMVWLAPGEACDLLFEAPDTSDLAAIEDAARAAIGDSAIDLLLQPATGRRKRLLVADLEATIIENEMLDELAALLGIGLRVAEITRRAMNGEIDFAAALEERVGLLAGAPAELLDRAAAQIRLSSGARALIATMRRAGVPTALVSGGFAVFAERVAGDLGVDRVLANRLELAAGHIAGSVARPIVTGETKRQFLLDLAAEHAISIASTMAVGDGANDLPMLQAAGLGVAFRAKPAVAAAARWRLDHADLRGLLYVQGYRREEIVSE